MKNIMFKNIVFRVDSSEKIGSGHLMRCLTLAKYLRDKAKITFVVRNLSGNLNDLIAQWGFSCVLLPRVDSKELLNGYEKLLTVKQIVDAEQMKSILVSLGEVDCVIIDHYAIDIVWEKEIHPHVSKIMVIDDLANRKHDCDILLDQNFEADLYQKYDDLTSGECKKFLGMKYLLLRDEFYQVSRKITRDKVKRILCFFGGCDVTNQTEKFLQAMSFFKYSNIRIDVVVGESNKNKNRIKSKCKVMLNVTYHYQIDYMAFLMADADLYIGSCGSTIWECAFLEVPSIVMATTKSELRYMKNLRTDPPFFYIGWHEEVSVEFLSNVIEDCISHYKVKRDKIKKSIIGDRNEIEKLVLFL